jgi:hypothetical protein
MLNKLPFEQIQTIIEQIGQDEYDICKEILKDDIIATNSAELKEEIFLYGIFLVGAKSFSHVLNVIERYFSKENSDNYKSIIISRCFNN